MSFGYGFGPRTRRRGVIAGITPPEPDPGGGDVEYVAGTGMIGDSDEVTLDHPADTQEGDLLIAVILNTQQTPTPPSGWTSVFAEEYVFAGPGLYVFESTAGSLPPANYSWSLSASANWSAFLFAVRDAKVDVHATSAGASISGGELDAPTVTASENGSLLVAIWTAARSGRTGYWDEHPTMDNRFRGPDEVDTSHNAALLVATEGVGAGATGTRTAEMLSAGGTDHGRAIGAALVVGPS